MFLPCCEMRSVPSHGYAQVSHGEVQHVHTAVTNVRLTIQDVNPNSMVFESHALSDEARMEMLKACMISDIGDNIVAFLV